MNNDTKGTDAEDARIVLAEIGRLASRLAAQGGTGGVPATPEALAMNTSAVNTPAAASTSPSAQRSNSSTLLAPLLQSASPLLRGGLSAAGASAPEGSGWLSGLVSPLLAGIAGLFGRDDARWSPTPIPFVRPDSVTLDYGFSPATGGDLRVADHDAWGRPRTAPGASPANPAAITIQVQALDSRSFLEHSRDIADAVKQALLDSHSLNDVLREG